MKKWIYIIFSILLSLFILYFINTIENNKKLRGEIDIYNQNIETLLYTRDTLEISNRALLINTDLLNYSNDSLIRELNKIRKDIKIKEKEIESLHKINLISNKKDCVMVKDNIFRDKLVNIDTTIRDKWSAVNIKLKYPSTIKVDITMMSDLSIFTYNRKEPIKKPKKTKLGRFFQKKRKVLEVEVVENNPNIVIKQNKFIKIIK